jgi:adenylate cyclase
MAERAQGEGGAGGRAVPAARRWRVRLGVSLVVVSVVTVLVSAAAVHVPWELTSQRTTRAMVAELNREIVHGIGNEVQTALGEAETVQDTLLRLGEAGVVDFDRPAGILRAYMPFLLTHPHFSWVSYGTPDGDFYGVQRRDATNFTEVVSDWDPVRGEADRVEDRYVLDGEALRFVASDRLVNAYFAPQRQWFRRAVERPGEAIWTDVYVFATSGKPGLNTAKTRPGPDGPAGVVSIAIEVERISAYLRSLTIAKNGEAFILDDGGSLIAASQPAFMAVSAEGTARLPSLASSLHPLLRMVHDEVSAAGEDLAGLAEPTTLLASPAGGQPYFVTIAPLNFQDWRVVTLVPRADLMSGIEAHRRDLIAILAGAVVLIGLLSVLVSRWLFVRPLARITAQTGLVADLQLGQVQEVPSRILEIDALSRSLVRMASSLEAFTRYLPRQVVRALHAEGVRPEVGGVRRTLSIMFVDVVNFTGHSERLGHRIVPPLSSYLGVISDEIVRAGGTLDKYIGDSVMAFWGAPSPNEDHANAACLSALALIEQIERVNREHADDPGWPALDVRIGINTGRVVVGNIGSGQLLDYTAIGDPVNLAARLEDLGKVYGVRIVVGQTTYEHAKYDVVARRLDMVAVRGRDERTAIYEILAPAEERTGRPAGYGWIDTYQTGLEAFLEQQWDEAIALFRRTISERGGDTPSETMIERAERAKAAESLPRLGQAEAPPKREEPRAMTEPTE